MRFLCILVLLVAVVLAQKSFRLETVSTDLYIQNSCQVQVVSMYTFNFLGYSYQKIGIPIRRDAVYHYSSSANNYVTNLMVTAGSATSVTQASVVAPDSSDLQSAYIILISFNPQNIPLNLVTFNMTYTIDGFLSSVGANNEVTWSLKSDFSQINDLSLRINLPSDFNLTRTQITASPINYVTTSTETLIEFKRAPLLLGETFRPKVTFPLRVSTCYVAPPSPLVIILVVVGVVACICICIPVCCVLGAISRVTNALSPASYAGTTTYYGNRAYNEPYTTVEYHHHHHGGYHHGGHQHHHHHSHSSSSSSSGNSRGQGSVFAV